MAVVGEVIDGWPVAEVDVVHDAEALEFL